MERGYIRVWRKVLDCGVIQNPHALQLFLWLLLNAAYEPRELDVRGELVRLQEGDVIFGRKHAAECLRVGERVIRTALQYLSKNGMIAVKSTNRFSLISIVNWNSYQPHKRLADQQATSSRPAADQQATTAKELKELKEKEKIQRAPARTCARARKEEGTEAPKPMPPKPQPFRPPQPAPKAGKAGGGAASREGEGVPKRRAAVDPDVLAGKKAPPMWKKRCYEEPEYEILDGVRYSKDELVEMRRHWLGLIVNSLKYPATGAESGALRVEGRA